MAERRVWIDDWQMQCCGDPFALGSTVTWSTIPVTDTSGFAEFLDEETATGITDCEERHAHEDQELEEIEGVVHSIDAVFCQRRMEGGMNVPIPGSGFCEPRSSVTNGSEPEESQGVRRSFVGYIVRVETEGVGAEREGR